MTKFDPGPRPSSFDDIVDYILNRIVWIRNHSHLMDTPITELQNLLDWITLNRSDEEVG